VVPLENASMPGRVVLQWDKDDCADMGLIKVDLLGLGMMAVIQDALHLVNAGGEAQAAPPLDIAHLPPDDPAVYRMLQEADTVGIFQVESRAQMATLPRLRPTCFYDIVVEVAIIRPGPIVGQMVHPYLKRRQGREPVAYPHPSLEPILRRTLGVPLFQEQLLKMAMVAAGFSGGEAEELRRAFGFKRSEKRMQQIEGKLRAGMARKGIAGEAVEEIIRAITSFALYGFPESHAASFALLVYASAYLKAHYPAAFFTSMLNNQPMGFYHPATLVKDAQRHGVRFAPIDVQESGWECRVEPDGRVRLGLMYVNGLRQEIGRAIGMAAPGPSAGDRRQAPAAADAVREPAAAFAARCPKCGCDDASMFEPTPAEGIFCNICAHEWTRHAPPEWTRHALPGVPPGTSTPAPAEGAPRYASLEDLVARTRIRRDELATLAEIGALNAFGHDRRSALWQIERAIRPAGALFAEAAGEPADDLFGRPVPPAGPTARGPAAHEPAAHEPATHEPAARGPATHEPATHEPGTRGPATRERTDGVRAPEPGGRHDSPLRPMSPAERVMADYSGTSLTIGPHPLALRRGELALRGVLRAVDLARGTHGRRVRVAGAVITRQRPGTAKGFVFLTLEDETGIANIIVRPDLFSEQRAAIIGSPYLLVEGVLQIQEGVTSVKAERVIPLAEGGPEPRSHDFR
jgi:error-prone DNA polymerase